MDLSFARFDRHTELSVVPGDLAVLMVGVAARQAASPTAAIQARVAPASPQGGAATDPSPLAPADGAFNGAMAAAITRWSGP